MSLKDQGFRFVRRIDDFLWVHAAEIRSGDLDCTDMTDEQFEMTVGSVPTPTCTQCGWYVAPGADCDRCGFQSTRVAGSHPDEVGKRGGGPTEIGENGRTDFPAAKWNIARETTRRR